MPMTRACALCNVSKSGPEAAIEDPVDSLQHTKFWDNLHRADCPTRKMSEGEKLDYFMENGSPVSSVEV